MSTEQEAKERLRAISAETDKALRYGDLWLHFQFTEHVFYAQYKAQRALLMHRRNDVDPAVRDDLVDAINSLRFAIDVYDQNMTGD